MSRHQDIMAKLCMNKKYKYLDIAVHNAIQQTQTIGFKDRRGEFRLDSHFVEWRDALSRVSEFEGEKVLVVCDDYGTSFAFVNFVSQEPCF